MKLPYGYVLVDEEIVVHEEKADVVRSIFEYYLAGASLGKIVDANQELKGGRKTAQKIGEYKHVGNKTYIALLRCLRQ